MTLTPKEFAFADAATSDAMGLPAEEHGLLFCVDERGGKWTVVGDAEYVRTLEAAPPQVLADLEVPDDKFPIKRSGWPDQWKED
jgi:hypothetical protein